MMEYWDHSCSIWLKNNTVDGINKPWIEKISTEDLKSSGPGKIIRFSYIDYFEPIWNRWCRYKYSGFMGRMSDWIYRHRSVAMSYSRETVKIDPKNLDPNTEVMRFWPLFQHSIIPYRRHKTSVVKSYMISISYRNSETLIIYRCRISICWW